MAWLMEIFKDLTRKKVSDKILHDTAFNIAIKPKYDGDQRNLASMVYKFFDKKYSDAVATLAPSETLARWLKSDIRKQNITNKNLAGELHKPIIRKLKKKEKYTF